MKTTILLSCFFISFLSSFAQTGWKVCNTPVIKGRIDDLFMVNTEIGYAVDGSGKILKTTDGGENWDSILHTPDVYCRSVEFINASKGFVGGFTRSGGSTNVFRRTTDGGATWADLTPLLHPRVKKGICGLAVADSNTIYGGGNWHQDSAFLIKSTDGGATWSFIDMSNYASAIIDMHFLNKDTGFVTGSGLNYSAAILYTTDGGASWSYKFQNSIAREWCWKIQRLTERIYFASIENLTSVAPTILRSDDGGMTWSILPISPSPNTYNIQGIGFIDPMHGWVGGDRQRSFETKDGGKTWKYSAVCPYMNRAFRVNDTLMFAAGDRIWKYIGQAINPPIAAPIADTQFVWMKCYPNPVKSVLTIEVSLSVATHAVITLLDESGRRIKVIDNSERSKGSYQYYLNTSAFAPGPYFVVLKTHEDKKGVKIIVKR